MAAATRGAAMDTTPYLKMSLILLIETATTICSVAIAKNRQVIAYKEIDQRNIHAEVVTLFIEELLKKAGAVYKEIDAIAVSSGPGSYTGLRIGVSTAKGLCFALDKPLIAVDTLAAMANGLLAANNFDDHVLLCPMIDARRMEVYTGIFDIKGEQLKETAAEIIDENSFTDMLTNHRMIFFWRRCCKMQGRIGRT